MDIFTHNVFWLGKMGPFLPLIPQNLLVKSAIKDIAHFSGGYPLIIVAKFKVYTSNTLGEIDEQFSSVRRLKKTKNTVESISGKQ